MFDIAIIGAGAAGIAAAKSAFRAGLKVVLIENDRARVGGTCLNNGCIPTKFFINSAKTHQEWQAISRQSSTLIERIKSSLISYLEAQKVEFRFGIASFLDKNKIQVNPAENTISHGVNHEIIEAKNFIIAAGSLPAKIIEHPKVIFAQDIFSQQKLPQRILIIGAGYIGVECASLFNSLGREVTLIEKENNILPTFDKNSSSRLRIILEKKGIKIYTEAKASQYNLDDFELIISSVGRIPNAKNLALEKAGISVDEKGWIKTDELLRTNISHIYCCGDVNGKRLLAYTAEYQAQICVDNIMGKMIKENYKGLPDCVFSLPQLAKVGISQEEAQSKNIKFKSLRTNFLKFSSSLVYNDNDGFIEILAGENDEIIGATIISNQAADLISLLSLCLRNNLRLANLKDNLFIHPTLSEILPNFLKEI